MTAVGSWFDDELRATQDHILVMGNCTGKYLFKHVAEYEAETVGKNTTARSAYTRLNYLNQPN